MVPVLVAFVSRKMTQHLPDMGSTYSKPGPYFSRCLLLLPLGLKYKENERI
jgi:hypothetical protein